MPERRALPPTPNGGLPANGLTGREAQRRLAIHGPNRLTEESRVSFWGEFLEELRQPMVLLLLVTGGLYAGWGEPGEAVAIFGIILALNTIEVLNELRARRAITALRALAEPTATVVRDGASRQVPAEEIVPGDLILIRAGRRIPADAVLLDAYGLAVDESTLTGESVPVEKTAAHFAAPLPDPAPLDGPRGQVFAGTLATRGRGRAVVTATGMATELGRIAGLARQVKEPPTPLQKAMTGLSGWMVWPALGFSLLVPLLGVWIAGQPLKTMLLTGLSLAFATIPEELPVIITLVLALGGYRLSKQHAIARRLKAVETLGSVTVIATDKTGTLTENRMQVQAVLPAAQAEAVLTLGVLSAAESAPGDPLEAALQQAAVGLELDPAALAASAPLLDELTFDSQRRRATVVRTRPGSPQGDQVWVIAKGAPEAILEICTQVQTAGGIVPLSPGLRAGLLESAGRLAAGGLRLLALADKTCSHPPGSPAGLESALTFSGLVGLADPPRPEVRAAIAECRRAGIRTLMITGDHPGTAAAVAAQVGLEPPGRLLTGADLEALDQAGLAQAVEQVSIFARITPEQKLRIVTALQQGGQVVAVTGDGVNDAPALAAADIGVAMGASGSDVARQAGDLVLADDRFTTIAQAVREGRALYATLQKGVRYYLACKAALIGITLLPVLLQVPVPFAPIQIILMELLMDLAAAAAFVAEPSEGDLMDRPPRRPNAPFLDRDMLSSILQAGAGLFAAVSLVYLLTWYGGAGLAAAQTMAFTAWLLGHVLLAFNLRSTRRPLTRRSLFTNRLMTAWAAAAAGFAVLVTCLPALHPLFKTTSLTFSQWALVLAATLAGTTWLDLRKRLQPKAAGP